jgi:aryl-phospho-beta-D-glucosidase BglC (GH1 family)
VHPDSDFKKKLTTDNEFVVQFADYWRALAQHYSTRDPIRTFFEFLNEPEFRDRYGLGGRAVEALRGHSRGRSSTYHYRCRGKLVGR